MCCSLGPGTARRGRQEDSSRLACVITTPWRKGREEEMRGRETGIESHRAEIPCSGSDSAFPNTSFRFYLVFCVHTCAHTKAHACCVEVTAGHNFWSQLFSSVFPGFWGPMKAVRFALPALLPTELPCWSQGHRKGIISPRWAWAKTALCLPLRLSEVQEVHWHL